MRSEQIDEIEYQNFCNLCSIQRIQLRLPPASNLKSMYKCEESWDDRSHTKGWEIEDNLCDYRRVAIQIQGKSNSMDENSKFIGENKNAINLQWKIPGKDHNKIKTLDQTTLDTLNFIRYSFQKINVPSLIKNPHLKRYQSNFDESDDISLKNGISCSSTQQASSKKSLCELVKKRKYEINWPTKMSPLYAEQESIKISDVFSKKVSSQRQQKKHKQEIKKHEYDMKKIKQLSKRIKMQSTS